MTRSVRRSEQLEHRSGKSGTLRFAGKGLRPDDRREECQGARDGLRLRARMDAAAMACVPRMILF